MISGRVFLLRMAAMFLDLPGETLPALAMPWTLSPGSDRLLGTGQGPGSLPTTMLAPELVEVGVFHSPTFIHSSPVGY
jgi:hypothetical protein